MMRQLEDVLHVHVVAFVDSESRMQEIGQMLYILKVSGRLHELALSVAQLHLRLHLGHAFVVRL